MERKSCGTSDWEIHDSFVPSETLRDLSFFFFSTNVMSEEFSVKRLPGSRTVRDLMISSEKRSFQRLHRSFRVCSCVRVFVCSFVRSFDFVVVLFLLFGCCVVCLLLFV